MNPGELNKRITIQQQDGTVLVDGVDKPKWIDFRKAWASVKILQGRELYLAQANNPEMIAEIKIRYTKGITAHMRVLVNGHTFEIIGPPIDPGLRHVELILPCKEVMP